MTVQNQRSGSPVKSRQAVRTQPMQPSMPMMFSTQPTGAGAGAGVVAGSATTNGAGPRVSFNRDVHVKRIGKHPNELTNYETTNLQPAAASYNLQYHQLPPEVDAEEIRKEAALVLSQAERHKSKAQNGDNIPIFRIKAKRSSTGGGVGSETNPKKFHSLPTREKKSERKPVARSASDAAKKPTKRPSIFGLFSRKSDSNVNQIERDPRFEDSGGRRLVRSKSDASSSAGAARRLKKSTKDQQANSSNSKSHLSTPLSPIIEQSQKEDYLAEQFQRERRKSDAVTVREKHESSLNELLERSRSKAEVDGTLLRGSGVSAGIKDKILTLKAKSNDNMHSSQLPAERLPLTKGRTVNGLVKRLSMERFSPQPAITQPAFSYIRPNEGITYAQLDLSDEPAPYAAEHLRTPVRDVRTPMREFNTLVRDIPPQRPPRPGYDRTDFATSPRVSNGYGPTHAAGPTTIRISSSHSPSPWQQLSPRNLSDEDEGLGIETRKYYDEELSKQHSKEPPIVPIIRSVTPVRECEYFNEAPAADDLGYRRTRLESRILTRRFGDTTFERQKAHFDPTPHTHERTPERFLSPEREAYEARFHRPETNEILKKYSPERSHLDMVAPTTTIAKTTPKTEKTSRYRHTKYYDDGHGGVKEVYERETQLDGDGKPQVRESRHRERLDSYSRDYVNERQDYEPKSLDSQFTSTDQYRSSPEMLQRYELGGHHMPPRDEHWHSSLNRDKLQQRSFDKGDSGIENDFRKESFNGDITTRWRKRTIADDMKACESFLKKERRHTEQQHVPTRLKDNYIYRERSIDDGSHFDPHLDKYPTATNTLRRRDQQSQTLTQTRASESTSTLKRNKKIGGFEKVKQLFTGGGGGSSGGVGGSGRSSSSNLSGSKKESATPRHATDSSTLSRKDKDKEKAKANSIDKGKERYMVREEEMRSRYREYRANNGHLPNDREETTTREPKTIDISMRRRLSTPKASPLLLKRTSSDKSKKSKESPLAATAKPEKTSWFKSLDRRAKSKSKEKLNVSVNGQSESSSTLKRNKRSVVTPVTPAAKNLRFFGDTDLDSNPPTITKASTKPRTRPSLASAQKYSQSAYNLDRLNIASPPTQDYRHSLASQTARHRSTSMQNLENGNVDEVDFRKRRHYSRSRELDDISESGSEREDVHKPSPPMRSTHQRGMSLERQQQQQQDRSQRYDEHTYRRSNERQTPSALSSTPNGESSSSNTQQRTARSTLMGPPKPARSAERRLMPGYIRERERYPAESSGTEGESSLHSQRSIVYLHATTVGDIPQPYNLRRRSISRDDLRKGGGGAGKPPLQPMTRTVSRSVSMIAPWKPKLISEGYEINYSQEQNKRQLSTLPRKPPPHNGHSTSTLSRLNRKSETPSTAARGRGHHYKDDQSSTSASKSMLSTNLRSSSAKIK